ncbi:MULTISPECIES: acyl-CoA dehydrogenase family protein [Pseudomonadaceae]|jgi:alkylation response protein AidB-like acyl-CoA dehydrogenase|uniref:Acyl-CoA dehydrogenase family protein n=1 Tax=Ectopseudomonas toyotomiensis TaxID=554344 RepID=A0AA42IMJ1_9GAMM|nr:MULTISPECIES: acyl-CoA dehydrogenase family protein [Pseudomonadaceae]RRU92636.1 acyl-CoA dehydrogenase [Stutzerimonas xanthomarina]HCF6385897.1 acyl-CoA dehydrogenase family protein [Pseudomonas aeruginosa]MBA1263098.1 acyl-CoA dehydrogenase [Stutzerimonas stutzeri]MBG0842241.1 acyl-CoA dehydrogenase family protein [Pseudomonas toyotomiensis]MDH0702035.1 acyl-CoA dehydrogenase family protein [Pseudomonas toyotomiensis]
MDFQLNEEQSMLRDSVRRFMEDNCSFEKRGPVVDKGSFDSSHWQQLAELGLLGLAIPEEFGGMNCSALESALVMEENGRMLCVEPYWAVAVLAAQTLAATRDPKVATILQTLCTGELLPVLAHEEAGAHGRPAYVQTRAVAIDDERWRISGEKAVVVAGNVAELLIVSARTSGSDDDEQGISLFVVDPKGAGVERRDIRLIDNRWATHLYLRDVEVGRKNLLGAVGLGFGAIRHGLEHATVALCAEAIGVMERALWITRDYLKIRKQFGQLLGDFQSLQHRMSEMLIELELSRGMLHYALSSLNKNSDERAKILSMAKAHIGKSGQYVCGQAIQLHGGIGVTEEYVIGHYFKRMTLINSALGSSMHHFEKLAELERTIGLN